ncbi:MAG TPA: S8 family serine peptidase [Thermoanaerobaculia bacterium]|nr:S8 family serine peptidase [Thermoanaerobaculia bacterium]
MPAPGAVPTSLPTLAAANLPPPAVVIDPTLKPARKSIAGLGGDGPVRPLAAIAGQWGVNADFVENEIVLFTNDFVAAQKMATRWKGQLLASVDFPRGRVKGVPAMHLIRIDSSLATPATLSADLQAVNPNQTNKLRVSSGVGRLTLAVAARESKQGMQVGLNWVLRSNAIRNRTAREGPGPFVGPDNVNYGNDSFRWPYFDRGSPQNIGVGEAWRALVAANKVGNTVDILIVDSGFDPNGDFPPSNVEPTGTAGVPGPGMCDGVPCPFHGTDVAMAGFAVPDNQVGAAGPGGLVAHLTLVNTPSLDIFEIFQFLESLISSLFQGPRIISISGSSYIPASVCLGVCPALDLINVGFRALNILTIGGAGNEGGAPEGDVDREDCIGFACWEAGAKIPCEILGVLCVGGVDWNSTSRDPSSGYGSKSNDPTNLATVRMFAPYTVWIFNPHNSPDLSAKSGTSYSTPFVAGVAALVMAADPFMSGDNVHGLLVRTANSSPDPTVPRIVNAFEAVKAALGGSVPPTVTLVSPAAAVTKPQDHVIEFEVRAISGNQQNISSSIVWNSNNAADNPLPNRTFWIANDGAHPSFSLLPGTRRITASVTDGAWTDSSSVDVTVTEVPVSVDISSPSPQSNHFFPGDNLVLIGTSESLGGLPLPNNGVRWFLDNASGTPIATGHGPIVVGASTICATPPCQRQLLFTGTNGRTSDTDTREVFVDPTPVGPPPTVIIANPANNASYAGAFLRCTTPGFPSLPVYSVTLALQGSAMDQNGVAIPEADLTWRRYRVGGPVIGAGGTLNATVNETQFSSSWQPISVQIFLTARDSQRAIGSASVTITITTPPRACP